MIRAAGVLIQTPQKTALFLRRNLTTLDHPDEWCLPGGCIEDGETPEQAAIRECQEEIQYTPTDLDYHTRRIQDADFTTFIHKVDSEFLPKLNDEHVAFCWAPLDAPPQPLHPGCTVTLARDGMNEQQVAQAIAAGELTSPQQFMNCWLFAMRITGTGLAYRHKHKEHVWRDPSLYMTPEFRSRCAGLPVIVEHPPKAVLDSKEFGRRNVGAIIYPYLKPEVEEVWGIARILDSATAQLLSDEQMSTSPSVVFKDPDANTKLETDNGTLLVEGEPSLLDHLAICENGVWDKGGSPSGIDSTLHGELTMADENTARADATDTKLDKLIGLVGDAITRSDSIGARLDALETRLGEPARADADDKDEKKDDADEDKKDEKKDDSIEDLKKAEKKSDKKADTALDKNLAKQDSDKDEKKDDEDKDEKKDDADMSKCDTDEPGEFPEKPNEVAADKKRGDSVKRGDSAFDRLNRLESLLRQPSDAEFSALADAQEAADNVFHAFGDSAPRPMAGETTLAYRLRMVQKLQSHSTTWKNANLAIIAKADSGAFGEIEKAIFADAAKAAEKPKGLKPGQFLPHTRADSTGRQITTFRGTGSFVKQFKPLTRRVTTINTRFNER